MKLKPAGGARGATLRDTVRSERLLRSGHEVSLINIRLTIPAILPVANLT